MLSVMMNEHLPEIAMPGTDGGHGTQIHPRPQLTRASWADLSGPWDFAVDDGDCGRDDRWWRAMPREPESAEPGGTAAELAPKASGEVPARRAERATRDPFDQRIVVPFPPESSASGIGDTGFHPVVWYRTALTPRALAAADHVPGNTLLVHFGAVDYIADTWIDGVHLAHHEGGHTPFSVEVPADSLAALETGTPLTLVVRAQDDPEDIAQPRGKQDWRASRHAVWYDRTTGIWQPVWLESVPRQHLTHLAWRPDANRACVALDVEVARRPRPGTSLEVGLMDADGSLLAEHTVALTASRATVTLDVPAWRNGQDLDRFLWSPDDPVLLRAGVALVDPGQDAGPDAGPATPPTTDRVGSYLGVRSIATAGGQILLNGRPTPVHAVLSQGFWPTSHLAAPGADALRAEVQLIRDLGFTTARVHQKIEDPRFLYWADRLGLMVWEEMPSAYEFGALSTRRLLTEWQEAIHRDVSHPCIIAWVPFNESWGVQDLTVDAARRDLVRAAYHLTKSVDPSRLVISNDGWEHTVSDLFTIHDYDNDPDRLRESYATPEARAHWATGLAPNGRRAVVGTDDHDAREQVGAMLRRPFVLSEFGGVSILPDRAASGGDADRGDGAQPEEDWGYQMVADMREYEHHLADLFDAMRDGERMGMAGWCFTQLTDTQQEVNGLVTASRTPKLPIARLREIVSGQRAHG